MLADQGAPCEAISADCGAAALAAAAAAPEPGWIALHEPDVELRTEAVHALIAAMQASGCGVGFGALALGAGRSLSFPEQRKALRWRRAAAARAGLLSRPALAGALDRAGWRDGDPLRLHRLFRAAAEQNAPSVIDRPLSRTRRPMAFRAAIRRFESLLPLDQGGERYDQDAAQALVLLYGEPSAECDRLLAGLTPTWRRRLRHLGPGDARVDAAHLAAAALVIVLPDLRLAAGEGLADTLQALGTPYACFADAAHARSLTTGPSAFAPPLRGLFERAAGCLALCPNAASALSAWSTPVFVAAPDDGDAAALQRQLELWSSTERAPRARPRRLDPPWRRVALAGEPPPPSRAERLVRGGLRRLQASMAAR